MEDIFGVELIDRHIGDVVVAAVAIGLLSVAIGGVDATDMNGEVCSDDKNAPGGWSSAGRTHNTSMYVVLLGTEFTLISISFLLSCSEIQ